jgi:hypothetical protein
MSKVLELNLVEEIALIALHITECLSCVEVGYISYDNRNQTDSRVVRGRVFVHVQNFRKNALNGEFA